MRPTTSSALKCLSVRVNVVCDVSPLAAPRGPCSGGCPAVCARDATSRQATSRAMQELASRPPDTDLCCSTETQVFKLRYCSQQSFPI
ncbi:hypothetical protein EVAR_11641_1 [Eumeta japonica]|uniref:Uncharacterized protein n=1 Tax=Eumeta variegata TaxID=151549 RepID=A0A4C1WTZ3_EUMVA|nr:hypothetical protein EVAR_11641_1 [Eumeta japonica]